MYKYYRLDSVGEHPPSANFGVNHSSKVLFPGMHMVLEVLFETSVPSSVQKKRQVKYIIS